MGSGGRLTIHGRKVSVVERSSAEVSASVYVQRGPFEMIPKWLLEDAGISSHAIRVYLVIRSFGDESRSAWPGRTRIGQMIGQSRSTVTRAVQDLVEAGALCVHRRPGEVQQSNEYHVHWTRDRDCAFFGGPQVDGGRPYVDGGSPRVDGGRPPVDGELILKEPRPSELDTRSRVQKPVDPDPRFEEFWQTYPRKAAKGAARRAWAKAVRIASPDVIIAGASRYAADPHRDESFTAHPATWLNGERWLDSSLPSRESTATRRVADVMDVIGRAAARDRGEIEQ